MFVAVLNVKCMVNAQNHISVESPPKTSDSAALYTLLWSLHTRVMDPRKYLHNKNRPELAAMFVDIETVLQNFVQVALNLKEHLKSSRNTARSSQACKTSNANAAAFVNSKSLTSFELFEAQVRMWSPF